MFKEIALKLAQVIGDLRPHVRRQSTHSESREEK